MSEPEEPLFYVVVNIEVVPFDGKGQAASIRRAGSVYARDAKDLSRYWEDFLEVAMTSREDVTEEGGEPA